MYLWKTYPACDAYPICLIGCILTLCTVFHFHLLLTTFSKNIHALFYRQGNVKG